MGTGRNVQSTISENNYDYNDFNFIVSKNKSSSKDNVTSLNNNNEPHSPQP